MTLTPKATHKVKGLLEAKQRDDLALRIYVSAGGCRGFSYGMAWDAPAEDDEVLEQDGVRVLIDAMSAPYLDGAEVDFDEALMGGGFVIHNPNAVSTCGCGQSFKAKNGEGAASSCGCGH